MIVVDNYTAFDESSSAGPLAQTLKYDVCGLMDAGTLATGVFLGHIGDYNQQPWHSFTQISEFDRHSFDLTYHGALQEALGFTRQEIIELVFAVAEKVPDARTRIFELLSESGTEPSIFQEFLPIFKDRFPTILTPLRPTFKPVYPMTDVFIAIGSLCGTPYEQGRPPKVVGPDAESIPLCPA